MSANNKITSEQIAARMSGLKIEERITLQHLENIRRRMKMLYESQSLAQVGDIVESTLKRGGVRTYRVTRIHKAEFNWVCGVMLKPDGTWAKRETYLFATYAIIKRAKDIENGEKNSEEETGEEKIAGGGDTPAAGSSAAE